VAAIPTQSQGTGRRGEYGTQRARLSLREHARLRVSDAGHVTKDMDVRVPPPGRRSKRAAESVMRERSTAGSRSSQWT
jgi:hypothetical protein